MTRRDARQGTSTVGRAAALISALTLIVALAGHSALADSPSVPSAEAAKKCKKKGKKKCKKRGSPAPLPIATPTPAPAQLAISPTSRNFGGVPFPGPGASQVFTVANNGGQASGTPAVTLQDNSQLVGGGGPAPPSFAIGNNTCTAPIPAPGTCTVTVGFFPSMAGINGQATLTVSAIPGGTVTATLTGFS